MTDSARVVDRLERLQLINEILGGAPVPVDLDYTARTFRRGGNLVKLSTQEILVIVFLAHAGGEPRTHQQIEAMLIEAGSTTKTYGLVKILIMRMRRRLDGIVRIKNKRGAGYALLGIG